MAPLKGVHNVLGVEMSVFHSFLISEDNGQQYLKICVL